MRALLERGDEVRVLDNFSTGNRANLDGLDVEIVEGELRSYERVHNAVRGVEVVYHLGALGSVPRSVQDPLTSSAVNVEGTLNVLLAARDEGVRRVVFSSSLVGLRLEPRAADDRGHAARPDLAVRRRQARRRALLRRASARVYERFETRRRSATSTSSARGRARTRSTPRSIPLFITAIAAGEPITIYGDGEQSRDFTYVANVVDATIARGRRGGRERTDLQRRRRARRRRVNDVADDDRRDPRQAGREDASRRRAPGDIRDSWADVTAAREVLGWEPRVGLEEGLRRTVEALV